MKAIEIEQIAALIAWFEGNFIERGEVGAAVSVWQHGGEIISRVGGTMTRGGAERWAPSTLVPVWSATKGPAAVTCLLALHDADVSLSSPVARVWPGFASAGKAEVTFAEVLSHQAGVCALDQRASVLDHEEVVRALESQAPLWAPGSRQGYHARTLGFLLDEIVRRLTGQPIGRHFREKMGDVLDLDLWIGLPDVHHDRVAALYPGRMRSGEPPDEFMRAFSSPGSVTQRTFTSPAGLHAVSDLNRPDAWALGNASMGGVGSARGLGKFYAMLANGGRWEGREIVPPAVLAALSHPLSQAEDTVLCRPIAFSAGMMQDPIETNGLQKRRSHYGSSLSAFGHPGAGGSLAFADPENGIAFAYVMNQMEIGVLPGEKSLGMVRCLYAD